MTQLACFSQAASRWQNLCCLLGPNNKNMRFVWVQLRNIIWNSFFQKQLLSELRIPGSVNQECADDTQIHLCIYQHQNKERHFRVSLNNMPMRKHTEEELGKIKLVPKLCGTLYLTWWQQRNVDVGWNTNYLTGKMQPFESCTRYPRPQSLSLSNRVLWSTVSKAALRFPNKRIEHMPSSAGIKRLLVTLSWAVSVLWCLQKPEWNFSKTLFSCVILSWLGVIISLIFVIKGIIEISPKFWGWGGPVHTRGFKIFWDTAIRQLLQTEKKKKVKTLMISCWCL